MFLAAFGGQGGEQGYIGRSTRGGEVVFGVLRGKYFFRPTSKHSSLLSASSRVL